MSSIRGWTVFFLNQTVSEHTFPNSTHHPASSLSFALAPICTRLECGKRSPSYRSSKGSTCRLDYQPLFGKGARAPPLKEEGEGRQTRESGGNRAYNSCYAGFLTALWSSVLKSGYCQMRFVKKARKGVIQNARTLDSFLKGGEQGNQQEGERPARKMAMRKLCVRFLWQF